MVSEKVNPLVLLYITNKNFERMSVFTLIVNGYNPTVNVNESFFDKCMKNIYATIV